MGKRLAGFDEPDIHRVKTEIRATCLKASTTDLLFPRVALDGFPVLGNVSTGVLPPSDFVLEQARTQDATNLFSKCPRISQNLFVPLIHGDMGGKQYRENEGEPDFGERAEQQPTTERVDGYRKAFQRVQNNRTSATVKQPSFWDMLLPILQPPIAFDFVDVLDLPPRCSPYPFQWEGIKFLVERKGALLGDDMGTGKTVQSALAMRLLFQRGVIKSAVIVCPLSVLRHWDRELERWAPDLLVTVVRGNKEHRQFCWRYLAHVWLITYDTLRQDIATEGGKLKEKFDLVILDEAQRIKNPGTGITKAVRALKTEYRWALSGTPIENKLDELVAIFAYVRPGLLKYEGITPAAAKRAIQPYFLRRRKKDVLKDLPEKHEYTVYLRFEDAQMATYKKMEKERVLHLHKQGETVTAGNILTLIMELKKLCNRDRVSGESAKLTWLKENIEDMVSEKDKVLVFSQYREEDFGGLDWLEKEMADYGVLNYGAANTDTKRDTMLSAFKKEPEKMVFLGNPRTAGVGLNDLVAANYVIHFDHWWNPAVTNQATARAHRPGQKKEVFVYHLWVEDTIEEMIQKKLEEKQLLYDAVIDSLSEEVKDDMLFDIYDDLLSKYGFKSVRTPTDTKPATPVTAQPSDDHTYGTPRDFEELVASLFRNMGFHTRLTPASNDKGVDVIAVKESGLSYEKLAVQCKLVSAPVGRPVLQQLLGVIAADPSYTRGVLVTNNRMSRESVELLKENGRLTAIEGSDLTQLLKKHAVAKQAGLPFPLPPTPISRPVGNGKASA